MPTLKQITCSIELGYSNVKLPEYQVKYGDGRVKCRIATPEEDDLPFSIHLAASGYIAAGLACHVFIDGELQCTRNAPCPNDKISSDETSVEFRVRQHETPHGQDTFIGREWTFTPLKRSKDSTFGSKRFDDRVGTIEVVVLRCRYDKIDFTTVPRLSKKDKSPVVQQVTAAPAVQVDTGPTPAVPAHKPSKKERKQAKKQAAQQQSGDDQSVAPQHDGAQQQDDKPASVKVAEPKPTVKVASVKSSKSDKSTSSRSLAWEQTDGADDELLVISIPLDHEAHEHDERQHPPWFSSRMLSSAQLDGSDASFDTISIKTREHKPDNASSSGFGPRSYWQMDEGKAGRPPGGRPTLVFPALPRPAVSLNAKPETDRAVKVGMGALYAHRTDRPVYIDTERQPYAVFTFKYCSPRAFKKLTGQEVGTEHYRAIELATKGQLEAMPRERLVAELLKMRQQERKPSKPAPSNNPAAAAVDNTQASPIVEPQKNDVQQTHPIHKAANANDDVPVWSTVKNGQDKTDSAPGFKPDEGVPGPGCIVRTHPSQTRTV